MIRLDDETDTGLPERHRAWEEAVAGVLAKARRSVPEGSSAADVLNADTAEGVSVPALAAPAANQQERGLPGAFPFVRGTTTSAGGWDVRSWVRHPVATDAARQIGDELEQGAGSVWLTVGGDGVPLADLGSAIKGVFLDAAAVVVQASGELSQVEAAMAFADLLEAASKRHPRHQLGVNPYASGRLDVAALTVAARRADELGVRGIVCDAARFADHGAGDAAEVGLAVAAGLEILRSGVDAGLSVDAVLGALEFRFAVTAEQFVQIAKLRAARLLWAGALAEAGIDPSRSAMRQHAVTARPMLTRYDSWTNLMRTTIAAFAAGVGGAESVTVLPFDSAIGQPNPLGRRLARNISTLLVEESHVAASVDAAGGAYAVEALTDSLAEAAWEEVRRVEATGGFDAALEDGSAAARVGQTRRDRARRIRTRTQPITGVSEFPLAGEVLPEREPWSQPEPLHAYAEEFEALRDQPAHTPVLLATIGSVAAHTARASFALNLCAAGGIPTVSAGATKEAHQVADALREAGTTVAILCGSDQQYEHAGEAYVAALREAGATYVVLAGRPAESFAGLVDDHIAAGQDAVAACSVLRAHLEQGHQS